MNNLKKIYKICLLFLCLSINFLTGTSQQNDPDKKDDSMTISKKFKDDIVSFYRNAGKQFTILEIGCYYGYTTRILADIFKKVYAVDNLQSCLNRNITHNTHKTNIEYILKDVYKENWDNLKKNHIDIVIIDAAHDYKSVVSDITNSLSIPTVKQIIFDDFGAFADVNRAVSEFVQHGYLAITKKIGYEKGHKFNNLRHGTLAHGSEGIICQVLKHIK